MPFWITAILATCLLTAVPSRSFADELEGSPDSLITREQWQRRVEEARRRSQEFVASGPHPDSRSSALSGGRGGHRSGQLPRRSQKSRTFLADGRQPICLAMRYSGVRFFIIFRPPLSHFASMYRII